MILKGKTISLRPFVSEDIKVIHEWRADQSLRFMTLMHPFPITLEQDKEWIARIIDERSGKDIFFAAELNETTELIGYFKLTEINFIHRHAFLGIIIGKPEERGKGLGKEILDLGLNYGFNMLGLIKISLEVIENNESGINLYKKLGFIQEGYFQNHYFFDGKRYGIIRMAKIITQ
jgi:UDP-4-amino-4,6-dideoxy-N-acetyl-beta-L-altrosamine N-acetyltransferase